MRVDASVADETEEVERRPAAHAAIDGGDEPRIVEESAVRDRPVDPADPLIDDKTGAEIEVTDFGVAHLSRRETDVPAGAAECRVWVGRQQSVHRWRVRGEDGIARFIATDTPAVQNHE